jgi:alpha-galactosidase/6-phospho-beta-glucosidase family protein
VDVLQRLKEMGYCRSDDQLPCKVEIDDPMADVAAGIRAGFAIWRELGYLPSLADRHSTENWPWFLASDTAELPFGIHRTSVQDRIHGREQSRRPLEEYATSGDESALEHLGHGDDPIVTVIEALSGKRTFVWGANYANIGQISELPLDSVVETRCQFDGAGVHPHCSPMPPVLVALVAPHVVRQEALIDIALSGTFDELVALVMTDPLCSRLKIGQCREMVREMLCANQALIQNARLLTDL